MADLIPFPAPSREQADPPCYASFILRCWMDSSGQVRARLFDVHSGVGRPLVNLAELSTLVQRLIEDSFPGPADGDAAAPGEQAQLRND